MKKQWVFLSALTALLLLPGCQSTPTQGKTTVILATGPPDGYYQKVCTAMREVGRDQGLEINCLSSKGSRQNVYKLERHEADFAIVQGDVAHHAWKGELPFDEPHEGIIRLVAPLFTEKVHILVGPHQYLTSLKQLENRRVWTGAENSGTSFSATALLQAAQVDLDKIKSQIQKATSLDGPKALALLRAQPGHEGDLVAVIEQPPNEQLITHTLLSMGLKKRLLPPFAGAPAFNVILRPDLSISNVLDLQERDLQLPKDCCPREAAALVGLGATPVSQGTDVANALHQLQEKKIDALIQPEPLTQAMMCAILHARGYEASPFIPDPRTKGKQELMIYLRPGFTEASAVAQALQGRMKIWWPEHDAALDEAVLRALIPDGSNGDVTAQRETLRGMDREVNFGMALDLLRLGDLDAVFQSTVAPESRIRKLVSTTEVGFLGIDWPIVNKLSNNGTYVQTSLQRTAYPVIQQGVYTVGVQGLLLTGLGLTGEDARKVETIARFLRDRQPEIEAQLSNLDGNEQTVLTLLGTPLSDQLKQFVHDSARPFLVFGRLRPRTLVQLCLLAVGIFVLGAVGLLLERGRRFTAYTPVILFLLAFIFLWACGATWLQAVEGEVSQDFASLPSAAWSLGSTVLAHFGLPTDPAVPTTSNGHNVMKIFSWIGVLLVGSLVLPPLKSLMGTLGLKLENWRTPQPPTAVPQRPPKAA